MQKLRCWWKARTEALSAASAYRLSESRAVRAARPGAGCAECPLTECATGCRAAVLRMECDGSEARRLRHLGLFEGACVTVLDRQDGLLLDVCGARLALGSALASGITVLPLRAA